MTTATDAAGTEKTTDIKNGLATLFQAGDLVELRAELGTRHFRGFHFTDHDRLAELVERLDSDPRIRSLYYIINPLKPGFVEARARCGCKICARGGRVVLNPTDGQAEEILAGPGQHLCGNEDVDRLNFLFIDIDTVKAPGFEHASATAEEKRASRQVAKAVVAHLESLRWPLPVLADSGNGWHTLPRVRLGNSDHNVNLLGDCLKALHSKFTCAAAKIDCAVYNAARLTRAYGTTTRKGDDTPERPWRRNRVVGEGGTPASLDNVLALGLDVPPGARRSDDGMPVPLADFSSEDYFEWFAEQGAFEIEAYRDWRGNPVAVTDTCLIAGHKHSGSVYSGFIYGDTFGYKCFSDDCEGLGLAAVHERLREGGFAPYPHPIFEDDTLAAVQEWMDKKWAEDLGAEEKKAEEGRQDGAEFAVEAADPEPGPERPGEEAAPKVDDLRAELVRLADLLLACVLHHPEETWQDGLMLYVKRIKERMGLLRPPTAGKLLPGEIAGVTIQLPQGETLLALLRYVDAHRKLPDKAALKHFIEINDAMAGNHHKREMAAHIDALPDMAPSTVDETCAQFVKTLDLSHERRSWAAAFALVKENNDIQGARTALRRYWNTSSAQDSNFKQGTWQERIDEVYADFEKDIMGVGDERKFRLGFKSIDNSDTTAALSVAMNFAIKGKNVLFFAGEHRSEKLLKRLTLQLAHFFKDVEGIGRIPGLSEWEGLRRTATAEDLAKVKQLILKFKSEDYGVRGFIEPQHIEAVTGGEEDKVGALLAYAEATFAKYQWDSIIIDPLDTVMPTEGPKGGASVFNLHAGIVNRLFDFSRNGFGGRGCVVIVTAQFKSEPRNEIVRIQEKNNGNDSYDDELISVLKRENLIQSYTTIGQRFDLVFGVACRTKGGSDGYIVKGRSREGGSFTELPFSVDPDTNYMTEKKSLASRAAETPLNPQLDDGGWDRTL